MIIPCPLCQARFAVPEERLKGQGTRIQCPKCHFTFVIKGGEEGDTSSAPTRPSTDTDPSIDPELAQRVKMQAAAAGATSADDDATDAEIDPALAEQVRKQAEVHGYKPEEGAAGGYVKADTVRQTDDAQGATSAPQPAGKPESVGAQGGAAGGPVAPPQAAKPEPVGAQGGAAGGPDAPPQAAKPEPVAAHDKAAAPPSQTEDGLPAGEIEVQPAAADIPVELEEVDKEVKGLSAEEIAGLQAEEIVDADDLAQVAEQSGETEAHETASARAEAEAAGQWPSIIVDEAVPAAEQSSAPAQSSGSAAPAANEPRLDGGAPPAGGGAAAAPAGATQAPQSQAELEAAMAELEAAQAKVRAAQQKAGMGETSQSGSVQPGSVAETFVIPGRKEAPARVGRLDEDPNLDALADEEPLEGVPKKHGWIFVVVLIVVGLALVIGAIYFQGKREEEREAQEAKKRKQALKHPKDPRWMNLKIGALSRSTLTRKSGGKLLVVTTKVRNESKNWKYKKITLNAELKTTDGKTLDSAWTQCNIELPENDILEAVKLKGRNGYYRTLEDAIKAKESSLKTVSDGEMLECQMVFFNLPKSGPTSDLKVDVEVDKGKTHSFTE